MAPNEGNKSSNPENHNLPVNSILFRLDGGGIHNNIDGFSPMSSEGIDMIRHMSRVLSEDNWIGERQRELLVQAYNALLPQYLLSKLITSLKYTPVTILGN